MRLAATYALLAPSVPRPLVCPVAPPAPAHSLRGGGAGGKAPPLWPPLTETERGDINFHDLADQWGQCTGVVLQHRCWDGAAANGNPPALQPNCPQQPGGGPLIPPPLDPIVALGVIP